MHNYLIYLEEIYSKTLKTLFKKFICNSLK
ncbi:hypothetical protein CoNPh26_CDS0077 [Staphylococcus phage S-CoN_Ph26]|nr:hypothetical protein CoNPh26_CDS0077 [Staphylococcus phage S-CoN_Ph26]